MTVADRFVKATWDYPRPAGAPILAHVVHMAEGGGTVGYLSGPNVSRGNSSHFVIEYDGDIVQMVQEGRASGSVNPNELRTDNDPDGLYGISYAKAALGSWWTNPNAVIIATEIEGFAKDGPNAKQKVSLARLDADLFARHPSIHARLGHRDFQDYKACPGKLIPWAALGGHGIEGGGSDPVYDIDVADPVEKLVDWPDGTTLLNLDGSLRDGSIAARNDVRSPFGSKTNADPGTAIRAVVFTRVGAPDLLLAVYTSKVNVRGVPVATADCTAKVAAQKKADNAAAHAAIDKAIPV